MPLRDDYQIRVCPVLELAIFADSRDRTVIVLPVVDTERDSFFQMTAPDLFAFSRQIKQFAFDAGMVGSA
jgi:hypothetical protein